MKKILLIAFMIWPFLVYAYAQENQTTEFEIEVSSEIIEDVSETKNNQNIQEFLPNTLLDMVLIGSGLASMFLVYILWRQTKHTEESNRLSYGPVIHGRFGMKSGYPRLFLKNYGNGPALDVNIEIKTPKGIVLDKVKRFALTPEDELHPTKVDLGKYPKVILKGTIKDSNFKIQEVDHVLDYPFMEKIDKNEKEEVKDE